MSHTASFDVHSSLFVFWNLDPRAMHVMERRVGPTSLQLAVNTRFTNTTFTDCLCLQPAFFTDSWVCYLNPVRSLPQFVTGLVQGSHIARCSHCITPSDTQTDTVHQFTNTDRWRGWAIMSGFGRFGVILVFHSHILPHSHPQ